MSKRLRRQLRYGMVISLLMFQGILMVDSAWAACYDTPRIAIAAVVASPFPPPASKRGGYRVTKTQSDPVLGQAWVIIISCNHPELPAFALQLNGGDLLKASQKTGYASVQGIPASIEVRAGDVVRLWRQESLLRIETAGVSEESGGLGKTIRVRLLHRNTEDQSTSEQLYGIVRGPLDVEMQP